MASKRQKWLYVVGAAEVRPVKIGISFDPEERLEALQIGSPVILRLLWKTPGGRAMEEALHEQFHPYWSHGEWFDFGDEHPVAMVAATAALLHHWTPPGLGLPMLPPLPHGTPKSAAEGVPAPRPPLAIAVDGSELVGPPPIPCSTTVPEPPSPEKEA